MYLPGLAVLPSSEDEGLATPASGPLKHPKPPQTNAKPPLTAIKPPQTALQNTQTTLVQPPRIYKKGHLRPHPIPPTLSPDQDNHNLYILPFSLHASNSFINVLSRAVK